MLSFGSKFVLLNKDSQCAHEGNASSPRAEQSKEYMDTNIMAIKFEGLDSPARLDANSIIRCKYNDCKAIFSHISKATASSQGSGNFKVSCLQRKIYLKRAYYN